MRLKTKLVLAITGLVFLIAGTVSLVYIHQLVKAAVLQTYETNRMVADQIWFALEQAIETGLKDRTVDPDNPAQLRGLVAETESLLGRGLAANPTALQALGYRQVVEHLRGERGLGETIALVKIRTRQFAKRQLTWFRRQMNLEWVTLSTPTVEALVEKLAAGV